MKLPPVLEALAESSDSPLARGLLRGRRLQQLAQVGGKAGGKIVPGVGEALMVADMARETAHQARKGARIAGAAVGESRKAKGLGAKARALASGAGRYAKHTLGSSVRVSAAALIGPSKKNPEMRAQVAWMLQTMPSDWRAQLDLCRGALQAAGVEAPPLKPTPEQALLALNLNNRDEPSSEVRPGQLQAGGVPVPDAVRRAAFAGLCLSHKNNYGGYHFIGIARAIQLVISPTISKAALNRIRMYFDRKTKQDRLSVDYAAQKGKRYWSWLNWGGDPAAQWSKSSRFAELVQPERKNPIKVAITEHAKRGAPSGRHARLMQSEAAARVIEEKGAKIGPKIVYEIGTSDPHHAQGRWHGSDPTALVLVSSPQHTEKLARLSSHGPDRISPYTIHTILHRLGDVIIGDLGEFENSRFDPWTALPDLQFTAKEVKLIRRAQTCLSDFCQRTLRKTSLAPSVWFPACVNTRACREGWITSAGQALAELIPMHFLYGGIRFLPTPASIAPWPKARAECDMAAAELAILLGKYIDLMLEKLKGYRVSI